MSLGGAGRRHARPGVSVALLPLGEAAAGLLASIAEEERRECWWLVLRDGTPVPGIAATAWCCSPSSADPPLGLALRTLRLSRAVDAVDRLAARHRGRLGRFVPDGPAPRAFP